MQRPRVLGFFAHPDDEAWAAGGTLALSARAGAEVVVLCATRGERRHGEEDLGATRSQELAASCRVLGAEPPRFLELTDGEVVSDEASIDRLLGELTFLAPDVVVTLGRDGGYGHREHLACTQLLDAAVSRLGREDLRVLHVLFPKSLLAPVRAAIHRGLMELIVVDEIDLGVEASDVPLRLDIREVAETKRAAIAAHASQHRGHPPVFLWPGLVEALLTDEWLTLAWGPPLPPDAAAPFAIR